MKLTNRYGLPDTFFQAVLNDKYSRGNAHYSATDLIRPSRITILSRRYGDEIEEDVSDRIWSVLGKAVHAILQAAETDNALTEERLFCEIGGRIISGASDLYEDGVVTDYKVTSVWTRIFGSRIEEWTQQLMSYRDLCETRLMRSTSLHQRWCGVTLNFYCQGPISVPVNRGFLGLSPDSGRNSAYEAGKSRAIFLMLKAIASKYAWFRFRISPT